MKAIDPGHLYMLDYLDGIRAPGEGILEFVKRVGERYPGNGGSPHPGTTVQEVLRVLIDRIKYVDAQKPSVYNQDVLASLREALMFLEIRAAEERGVHFPGPWNLGAWDTMSTCPECGHTFCEGGCK